MQTLAESSSRKWCLLVEIVSIAFSVKIQWLNMELYCGSRGPYLWPYAPVATPHPLIFKITLRYFIGHRLFSLLPPPFQPDLTGLSSILPWAHWVTWSYLKGPHCVLSTWTSFFLVLTKEILTFPIVTSPSLSHRPLQGFQGAPYNVLCSLSTPLKTDVTFCSHPPPILQCWLQPHEMAAVLGGHLLCTVLQHLCAPSK